MSCSTSFVILWHLPVLVSEYSFKVVHFHTPWMACVIGWHLYGSCGFLQYFQLLCVLFLFAFALSSTLFLCSCLFIQLDCLFSFVASISYFWALWASTPLTQANTCSLVICLFDCSQLSYNFSHHLCHLWTGLLILFFSSHLHLFSFILRWPIHFLSIFCSLINLWYCNDNIVLLFLGCELFP